jgi:hypothetical protein
MDIRSEEEIRESYIAEVSTQIDVSDFRPGGRFAQIAGANARAVFRAQQAQLEMRNSYLFGSITKEADADARGADVLPDGLAREKGYRALGGAYVFSRPAGAGPEIIVPAGTPVFRTRDGYRYYTIAETAIPIDLPNSPSVSVVAESVGSVGNCASGEIDQLGTLIDGVTMVENTAAIRNGVDAEDVSSYKERIRDYVKAIGNSNCFSLVNAALAYESATLGKVRFAALGPAEATDRGGYVKLYIDDGAGSAGVVNNTTGELLLSGGAGVEQTLYAVNRPIVPHGLGPLAYGVHINGTPVTTGWSLVEPWGQLRFDAPLTAGDTVELVNFGYYSGLVADVQKLIDGDISDPLTYPGKRAAGVVVQVLPASKTSVSITGFLVLNSAYDPTTWLPILRHLVASAINGLGIGEPVYRAMIYDVLMDEDAVKNVTNLKINGVDNDLYIGESSVARTTSSDVLP